MEELLLLAVVCGGVFIGAARRRVRTSARRAVRHAAPRPARPAAPRASEQLPRFDVARAAPAQARRTVEGKAHVVDGDTLVISQTQIRLFGVDAPELNHPYGKKAKWALVGLCKGQAIRAEISDRDAHGRTVARCFLPDGRDLSAEMVKLGLAIDWPKFSGGKYRTFETLDARRKLWLADARQKGRMQVWEKFEAAQKHRQAARG